MKEGVTPYNPGRGNLEHTFVFGPGFEAGGLGPCCRRHLRQCGSFTALKPLHKVLGSTPRHPLIMRFASRRSTRCRGPPSLNLPTRVLQFVPLLKGTRLCGGRPRTMCRGTARSCSFCLPVCLDLYYQRGLGIELRFLGITVTRSDDPTIGFNFCSVSF